jgi:hypothetical protein
MDAWYVGAQCSHKISQILSPCEWGHCLAEYLPCVEISKNTRIHIGPTSFFCFKTPGTDDGPSAEMNLGRHGR